MSQLKRSFPSILKTTVLWNRLLWSVGAVRLLHAGLFGVGGVHWRRFFIALLRVCNSHTFTQHSYCVKSSKYVTVWLYAFIWVKYSTYFSIFIARAVIRGDNERKLSGGT